jgi:hypothetical protein
MTAAQVAEVREIRRELIECGADPFEIAAQAVAECRRYRRLLADQERLVIGAPGLVHGVD